MGRRSSNRRVFSLQFSGLKSNLQVIAYNTVERGTMTSAHKHCYVPNCRIGYPNTRKENARLGVRNKSLFKATNPELLAKWDQAIGRVDRRLTSTNVVCELHFREDELIKYFETRLSDTVVHRIKRSRYVLKKDAVPSIFPLRESYKGRKKSGGLAGIQSVTSTSQDLEICENAFPSNFPLADSPLSGRKQSCSTEELSVGPSSPDCEMSEEMTEPFHFQILMKEALNMLLPSDLWTVGVLRGRQVIFANWSDGETFEARKRVLIDAELHVKIFFGSKIASLGNMKEVHSLAEVAAFLIVIDQLNICQSTRSPACLGYITPRDKETSETGTSAVLCHHCQKVERDSFTLDGQVEAFGRDELQSKIIRKDPNSSQLGGHLSKKFKKKMKKPLSKKGVTPKDKPSSEGAVKMHVFGESCAVDNSDMESTDEVDIEEWTLPSEWRSLATPMRLLSPPPEDLVRPTATPSATIKRREESPLDVETLVRDVHRIPLPSEAWTLGVVKGKRLIFASWRDGKVLEAEKRLVVDEDLSVKVIFGSMVLALDEITNVKKFEDIGRYLYIVDKMRKCNGIGTGRRAASCPGYFIPGQVRGMRYCLVRCAFCQGASEELRRIRRIKGDFEQVRAEAQGKVWKNLKKLSDLYPEMKKGVKASAV